MSKKTKPTTHTSEELEKVKAQLARALADYDNLKKRTEEQNKLSHKITVGHLVSRLLPIFDMLSSAQKHLQDPGIAIITKEFKDALLDLGVEEITIAEGDAFDPLIAEVIDTVETEEEDRDTKIAEIVVSGWRFKGEPLIVMRPSKVKVYKMKQENKEGEIHE